MRDLNQTLKAMTCPFMAGISPSDSSPARSIPTTPSFAKSLQRETISNDQSKDKKICQVNYSYIDQQLWASIWDLLSSLCKGSVPMNITWLNDFCLTQNKEQGSSQASSVVNFPLMTMTSKLKIHWLLNNMCQLDGILPIYDRIYDHPWSAHVKFST